MRSLTKVWIALLVSTVALSLPTAEARGVGGEGPGPRTAPGGSGSSPLKSGGREATGDEIAQAKAADPVKLLEEIEEQPKLLLARLEKELLRMDVNADQMRLSWAAIGGPELGLWRGRVGIVKEQVTARKGKLSDLKIKVLSDQFTFEEFASGGSNFLEEVVFRSGAQMAELKGTLNFEMKSLEKMRDDAKPVIEELHKWMENLDFRLDSQIDSLTKAKTNTEINQALRKIMKIRVSILNLTTFLRIRTAYVRGFLSAHEKNLDERTAMVEGFRATFQNPEVVKNVSEVWQGYVRNWLAHLEETIDDCEIEFLAVGKAWDPLLTGDFYKDIAAFTGRKVEQLEEPVRNVLGYAEERKVAVSASADLSTEIAAALRHAESLRSKFEAQLEKVDSSGAGKIEQWLKDIRNDPAMEAEMKALLEEYKSAWGDEEFNINRAIAATADVNGTCYEDLMREMEDALGDATASKQLRTKFEAYVEAEAKAIEKFEREIANCLYRKRVAVAEAEKLWKSRVK